MGFGENYELTTEITWGSKCLHKVESQDLYSYLIDKIETNMMGSHVARNEVCIIKERRHLR